MANDPIASRYAQALFEAAKAEDATDAALEQMAFIRNLLRGSPELRQFLWNPDVDPPEKIGVVERTLKGAWSPLVRSFVRLAISFGRAEWLPEIADAFQAVVDEDAGRLHVVVRSARPQSASLLARLRARLERLERKRIDVEAELAPELLGGLQVVLGHRLIDGSVRRQVAELQQQLASVRVH